jgi:hypothetical protein
VVFNATFIHISAVSLRSVLLVQETRVPGKNHRPAASHWQTLSHNVVSSYSRNMSYALHLICMSIIVMTFSTQQAGKCRHKEEYNIMYMFEKLQNIFLFLFQTTKIDILQEK